mgnify:CR=1 FL=1
MFDLPKATEIRKPIHKKLIYSKFPMRLKGESRSSFDEEISKIVVTNEISPVSISIKEGVQVSSVFVLQVELRQRIYSEKNIISIAKMFGQNVLLVLHHGEQYQFAIYETTLFHSEWQTADKLQIRLKGLDMDAVWENLVMLVSGIEVRPGNSLDEQIALEMEKDTLRKKIEELEKRARRELQSKKKFEMFQRLKEYQARLDEM